jgi:hypothetical protein
LHIRMIKNEVSNWCGYSWLALACRNFHHLVLSVRDVSCCEGSSCELKVIDGDLDFFECRLNCVWRCSDLIFKPFQGRI